MLNVKLLRFEQRMNKKVWDVRYGVSNAALATITERLSTGSSPAYVIQFYRHVGGFNSGPVVVPTREDAVSHIRKYYSGELERYVDDEP